MMRNKILIGIMVLCLILLYGCNKSYVPENLYECDEGKYNMPGWFEGDMKAAGIEVKYIEIIKTSDSCVVIAKLKKPTVILGSEIEQYPIVECSDYCMAGSRKYNYTIEKTINICCN